VQDTFCALAWVHANADTYDLDPDRIVALGYSAGGTLAAMLGVVDDAVAGDGAAFVAGCPHPLPTRNWVQGVVTFTGMFDFMRGAERSAGLGEYLTTYLGVGPDEDPATWAQASPSTWVDGSEPPFLLIHGLEDTGLSPEESKGFAAILEQAGVDVELVLVPDANHGTIIRSEQLFQAVVAFCARVWGRP
jgi:acetyl esterase/lipase